MPGRRFSDQQEGEILAKRDQDWQVGRIAAHFSWVWGETISPSTINGILLRHGAVSSCDRLCQRDDMPDMVCRSGKVNRRFKPHEDETMVRLIQEGVRMTEIGRMLGRRPNSILTRLRYLGYREERHEKKETGTKRQSEETDV